MRNKFIAAALAALLLSAGSIITSYAADTNTVIVLNIGKPTMLVSGVEKEIDTQNQVAPVLINDTTMVPIRAIAESMGGKVEWNDSEEKATVTYGNNKVEVWLNNNTALVNGVEKNVSVAPTTINERTMLPLRFVSESLGLCVNWEGSSEAISISQSSDYLAVVGGQIINKPEFNIYLAINKEAIYSSLSQSDIDGAANDSVWNIVKDGISAGDLAKKNAMESIIKHKLTLQKAKEANLTLSEDEVSNIDAYVQQIIQQYGDANTTDLLIRKKYNVSLAEYTDFLKENALVKKYLNSVYQQIKIPDEDIANVYEMYKPIFDKVTVQHILISTLDSNSSPLSTEKQEEARKKAEDILEKVKAGQDFAALAKEYSEDPGSKDSGGIYTFKKGDMIKEFEDWSYQAKDGDVGIIKSVYGYHVMKFINRSTDEEIKSNIRLELANKAINSYINKTVSDYNSVTVINQNTYNAIEVK